MDLDQCYRILGINRSASAEQVRRAYLEAVKIWHPDRFGAGALLEKQAEEALKQINAAYARIGRQGPHPAAPQAGKNLLSLCRPTVAWLLSSMEEWVYLRLAKRFKMPPNPSPPPAPAGKVHRPCRSKAKTFRQVLEEVSNTAACDHQAGRHADVGRRWLRLLQQRCDRPCDDNRVEGIEAVDPSRRVQHVGRVRRR